MSGLVQVCKHCWIEVVKQAEMKSVIGTEEENAPKWIHRSTRSETGNPFCGRQFLEDDDIETVNSVSEA